MIHRFHHTLHGVGASFTTRVYIWFFGHDTQVTSQDSWCGAIIYNLRLYLDVSPRHTTSIPSFKVWSHHLQLAFTSGCLPFRNRYHPRFHGVCPSFTTLVYIRLFCHGTQVTSQVSWCGTMIYNSRLHQIVQSRHTSNIPGFMVWGHHLQLAFTSGCSATAHK